MVETKSKPKYAERFASVKIARPDYARAVGDKESLAVGHVTFLQMFNAMLAGWIGMPKSKRIQLLREASESKFAA
jgi:hypothetical protein